MAGLTSRTSGAPPLTRVPLARCRSSAESQQPILSSRRGHVTWASLSSHFHRSQEKAVWREYPLTLRAAGSKRPHPSKWLTGGDDAFFVAEQPSGGAVGVADGASSWAGHGVDPALYSRLLMRNAAKLAETELSGRVGAEGGSSAALLDPVNILSSAQSKTQVLGTCTAAAATLNGAKRTLRVAHIGDAGFCILRDGRLMQRSRPQLHGPNCPFQLGCDAVLHSKGFNRADRATDARRAEVTLLPGDVVVLGSDGFLDNLPSQADLEAAVAGAPGLGAAVAQSRKGISSALDAASVDASLYLAAMALVRDASVRAALPGGHVDDVSCVVAVAAANLRPQQQPLFMAALSAALAVVISAVALSGGAGDVDVSSLEAGSPPLLATPGGASGVSVPGFGPFDASSEPSMMAAANPPQRRVDLRAAKEWLVGRAPRLGPLAPSSTG